MKRIKQYYSLLNDLKMTKIEEERWILENKISFWFDKNRKMSTFGKENLDKIEIDKNCEHKDEQSRQKRSFEYNNNVNHLS